MFYMSSPRRRRDRLFETVVFVLALAWPATGYCACATPVLNPADRGGSAAWADIERFEAQASLNSKIGRVQSLTTTGYGALNTDYYSITIDATWLDDSKEGMTFVHETPRSMTKFLRDNLSELIFSGSAYQFGAYDGQEQARWQTGVIGSLASFTLARIPGLFDLERGSVVLSCLSESNWIFSTVETPKDELHPVSGNRAFGVVDDGKGGLVIWTKAADRIVNAGRFALLPQAGRELLFEQGHQVWVGMLDRITSRFPDRNPRDRVQVLVRRPY